MAASLTMQNPVGPSVSTAIRMNKNVVDSAGKSLSTSVKANNNVVSQFLGKGLEDKAKFLSAIVDSMGYSLNVLKITSTSLDKMANTLSETLTLIAQATGQSESSRATLNAILKDKIAQVEQQTKNAVFDGRKLLTGDLGKNVEVTPKFDITPLNAISSDTKFNGAGTKAVATFTVGANTAAGEKVFIEDVPFTVVALGSPVNKDNNEFALGSTVNETARNLANAVVTSKTEKLQHYTASSNAATVVLTRFSSGLAGVSNDGNIMYTSSANVTGANTATGAVGALDLSGLHHMPSLVGSVTATIELLSQQQSANAKGVAAQYLNPEAIADATAANANDSVAIMKLSLAGKEFIGTLYQSNANIASLNGRTVFFKNTESGETIRMLGSGAWAGTVTTGGNATTAMNEIRTMINNASFYQNRTLDVSTDYGAVYYNNIEIANTNGVRVGLVSKDFSNRSFTDFTIKTDPANAAQTRFEAKIGEEVFQLNFTTANIATTLFEGYKLDLTSTTDTNSILSINLGEKGLTGLTVASYDLVAQVFKDMLMNTGSGLEVRIGEGFNDTELVKIANLTTEKLYKKTDGTYVSNLSVLNDIDAQATDEAIRHAINLVRDQQSKIATKQETINAASESLLSTIDVTREGADAYLKADLVDESQKFSAAIKSINAAIAVLKSGASIPDAAQAILQTI
jgi:hypothetical protein